MNKLTMNWRLTIFIFFSISLIWKDFAAAVEDADENCMRWAESGECEKNPGYMLSSCSKSCAVVAAGSSKAAEELLAVSSFFDLSANDIFGESIDFKKFQGQITILVNVASECGYTDSHYRGLVQLWNEVKHTEQVNILAFPCDQFGHQEPGTNEEINEFAVEEYGVDFTMMEKINVNGPSASIVWQYLKSKAGPSTIRWNFATYFVISPDGAINSYSGVEPMQLLGTITNLLSSDEL